MSANLSRFVAGKVDVAKRKTHLPNFAADQIIGTVNTTLGSETTAHEIVVMTADQFKADTRILLDAGVLLDDIRMCDVPDMNAAKARFAQLYKSQM